MYRLGRRPVQRQVAAQRTPLDFVRAERVFGLVAKGRIGTEKLTQAPLHEGFFGDVSVAAVGEIGLDAAPEKVGEGGFHERLCFGLGQGRQDRNAQGVTAFAVATVIAGDILSRSDVVYKGVR